MVGRIALLFVALAIGLGAVACGGDDDEAADETATEEATEDGGGDGLAAGRTIFVESCGGCHTLADAGTSGTTGPNLDDSAPSVDEIEEQVRSGGGGMPAFEGDLSDEEIRTVSEYVADAAGG
jgi:mono/diheme cytochrome c family protein